MTEAFPASRLDEWLQSGQRVYFQAIPVYTKAYHPRHQELGDAPLYVQYHIKPKNGPVYAPAAMNVA